VSPNAGKNWKKEMGTYDTVALPPAVSAPPRFVSILAARQNDTRPSGTYHTLL
jgi:hypothetical protein